MTGSPFYNPPPPPGDPIPEQKLKTIDPYSSRLLGRYPSEKELEDWYHILDGLVESASGSLKRDIESIRDDIYKYLR